MASLVENTSAGSAGKMCADKIYDVIIVGAGAAGLSAFNRLTSAMLPSSVLILESRTRPGGRLHTVDGCDHGAKYMHGVSEENPAAKLLKNAEFCAIGGGNPWLFPRQFLRCNYFVGGHPPEAESLALSYKQFENLMECVKAIGDASRLSLSDKTAMEEDVAQISLKDALEIIRKDYRSAGKMREDTVIKAKDLPAETRSLIRSHLHMVECWFGGSIGQLQLREFESRDSDLCGDYPGDHATVVGGMGASVVKALLDERADTRERIVYNSKVVGIDYSDDSFVVVRCEHNEVDAAGSPVVNYREFKCKKVISTLPIGVLKSLSGGMFHPPLPKEKVEAINSIGSGLYKKVIMTFDR